MEQLGPFHFFFTLSATEMRWPEVTTSILHYEQMIDEVIYKEGFENDNETNIMIYSMGWETDQSKIIHLPTYRDNADKKQTQILQGSFPSDNKAF